MRHWGQCEGRWIGEGGGRGARWIGVLVFLLSATTAIAQQVPSDSMSSATWDGYFGVYLTPVQRAQLKTIRDAYKPKFKAVGARLRAARLRGDTMPQVELRALQAERLQRSLAVL